MIMKRMYGESCEKSDKFFLHFFLHFHFSSDATCFYCVDGRRHLACASVRECVPPKMSVFGWLSDLFSLQRIKRCELWFIAFDAVTHRERQRWNNVAGRHPNKQTNEWQERKSANFFHLKCQHYRFIIYVFYIPKYFFRSNNLSAFFSFFFFSSSAYQTYYRLWYYRMLIIAVLFYRY